LLASSLCLPDLRRKAIFDAANPTLMEDLGLVHKAAAGRYSLLPLGVLVLERMKSVYRRCMIRANAAETVFVTMSPADIWRESGRWDGFGPALIKASLNGGGEICFNPTHEEAAVSILRNRLRSYRDLPVNLFCIQKVYRDEPRPKSELLRTHEFYMADSYSFHADGNDAERGYQQMQDVFSDVFERLSLPCRVIDADNGLIGGSRSVEFQYAHGLGESSFVSCECGFASDLDLSAAGPLCPDCGMQTKTLRGIEVAHVFMLEDTYSTRMKLRFRDHENKLAVPMMGCTGIGMTRVLQTMVLEHVHADGIAWPATVAPFELLIIPAGTPGPQINELLEMLEVRSVRYLLDDRNLPRGAKKAVTKVLNPRFTIFESAARDSWQLLGPGQSVETISTTDLIAHLCGASTDDRAAKLGRVSELVEI